MAKPPLIDGRTRMQLLAGLLAARAGYAPDWSAQGAGSGRAWATILARYLELQTDALNAMPEQARYAFLDKLGDSLLPAQPARTPLVFKLLDSAPIDVTLPERTRVAAQLPPPAPSLADKRTAAPPEPPLYYTEQSVRLTRASIVSLYSVDPQADTYAEHTAGLTTGFTLFDAMRATPHVLYLGHDEAFRLSGTAEIVLSIDTYPAHEDKPYRPLLLDWEYLSEDGWLPLEMFEDRTQRFTTDGSITLHKRCGPDAKEDTIAGRKSYWLRASVGARVPSARVTLRPAGYWLELSASPSVTAGDTVTIDSSDYARVLALDGNTVVLDRELSGAFAGAVLKHAPGGALIGSVVRPLGGFRVVVEDARELLAGDVVTADGVTSATLLDIDGSVLILDRAFANLVPGDALMLADALPPLSPEGLASGLLPALDVIRARVGFTKSDLPPDSAYADTSLLDTGNNFYPFGKQPAPYATFYFASKEVFQRRGARVSIAIGFAQKGATSGTPLLTPEYFNGARWTELTSSSEYSDTTSNFTQPAPPATGNLNFICPDDWQETQVNGEKGYFLRLRLDDGDYGHPLALTTVSDGAGGSTVETVAATLKPPVIATLRLGYTFYTNPDLVDHCVTYNDFAYVDRTDDARWPRRPFRPFTPVADASPALHFGFQQALPTGLVSLFIYVPASADDTAAPLPFLWEYLSADGWSELSVLDETNGFRASGMLQFVGPADMALREGLGGTLAHIRARLKPGLRAADHRFRLGGLWLNAVWGSQGERIERETLGLSSGDARQTFVLPPLHVPVLAGELIEVREWTGRGNDWETAVEGVPPADLRFEVDPRDQQTKTAVWVRWQGVPHLYASRGNARHYVIERASGTVRFGGGGRGMTPPAGATIVASFATGGGLRGNVPAGAITELRSGVGYVESVINPLAASGGAESELPPIARERATQRLRNRWRNVAKEDYEWLAREATPEVARVRCLPLLGPAGQGQRGYVSLVVVPQSLSAMPMPTLALTTRVLAHLRAHAPAALDDHIRIVPPTYVRVGIRAEIVPERAEEAALVESRLREALDRYLHPLVGRNDRGWDFGDAVYLSDIAMLVEATPGVDYARFLQLKVGDTLYADFVPVDADALIAPGEHQLKLVAGARAHAAA